MKMVCVLDFVVQEKQNKTTTNKKTHTDGLQRIYTVHNIQKLYFSLVGTADKADWKA